jgi:RND superfamily putative drug exporter
MFRKLASISTGRRRTIFGVWALVFVLGIVGAGQVFARLASDITSSSESEAARAERILAAHEDEGIDVVAIVDDFDQADVKKRASIEAAVRDVAALDGVARVVDPTDEGGESLTTDDGRAIAILVSLESDLGEARYERTVAAAEERLTAIDPTSVLVTGESLMDEEMGMQAESDLQKGELMSLPIVLIVLAIIFGGIVGAGMPLIVALSSVSGALLVLLGLTFVTDVSVFAVNVITMLGLGLAIDYSLLLINRFREERARGGSPEIAIERSLVTAGRTILFSGLTVAVALTGLMFFNDPTLRSLAYGGMAVVALAIVSSITLLPALLSKCGHRLKAPHLRPGEHGFLYRLSRFVQRRAVVIVVLVAVALVGLATPFLHINYGAAGVEALPRSSEARQVSEIWKERFEGGTPEPIVAVTQEPPRAWDVEGFVDTVEAFEGVKYAEVGDLGDATSIEIVFEQPTHSRAAKELVERVRALDVDTQLLVGGETAELIDYGDEVAGRLPFALGWIALATFMLLFLMTGSVVVPVKAIVMNLLSLTASFGILVWGFQDGNLAELLNFDASGVTDIVVPILVFVFAFGLSMDYEVFLLSRIKEDYDATHDNDHAVAVGLQRTGRTVTQAAILIVVVFAGFATGGFVPIKALGAGMAVAVILDATIVRMLLLPATMKLLGDRNWWAPTPLRRIHARFGLREHARPRAVGDVRTTIQEAS